MPEIGQTISNYKILEKIGQGGMGEVYLADDTSLERKVALKFLPDAFTGDPERMARFEREAKLLASLNHPNIAAIYGLEQADGKRFLVMEYVRGETLQAKLSKGALPLEETLDVCRQIAGGLEAAHEKGIIHRDLKPANVMITDEEKAKILDFGLAKALADEIRSTDSSQSPTITEAMTQPGVVLGTAAYMSPEQAKGKAVDKRADIWAFGCILYECLAGKKAFEGETVTETLAAVIKEEPDFEKVQARARPLLRQSLAKDQKRRLRDIGDAMIMLEGAPETVSESRPQKTPWLAWSMAIVFFLGLLVLGVLYFLRPAVETPRMISEVNTTSTSEPTSLAVSPDGRCLVYVASAEGGQQLWLRKLDETKAQPLPGTEGATFPFWSPDSGSVGFFAAGQLKRIDVAGGLPVALADAPEGLGGTWNRNDVIVFTPAMGNPLHRVSAAGGEDAVAVTQLNGTSQTSHNFPWFLPDGRHLLYFAWGAEGGIHLASLNSGDSKFLLYADSPAIYVHPGHLLFVFQGTLFAIPFDAERGEFAGDRERIADSVPVHLTFNHGGFSASETGLLAYRTRDASLRQLAWFDRSGNEIGKLGEPDKNDLANPELSPDGNRVAVDRIGQERTGQVINQIWMIDVARGVLQPFTFGDVRHTYAVWSPDAKRIAFASYEKSIWNLYQKPSSGQGNEEQLLELSESFINRFPCDWSPDGQILLYHRIDPITNRDIWVLPLNGSERDPYPFANESFEERNGQFSPDGRFIAYQSDESGISEVYVQAFPKTGVKEQISNGGGMQPRWGRDCTEIFYIDPDGKLMVASIEASGEGVEVGESVSLFQTKIALGGYMDIMRAQYDVSRDGRRFLINNTVGDPSPSPITIVTNWTSLLKK